MGDVANVTVGPSQLFVAVAGTAKPNMTGNATDFAAFTALGFTDDGIEWDYTPTFKDIMVDELLGPVKKIITNHKLVVSTKLAETTLQNLTFAIAAATFNGTDTVTIGSVTAAPEFLLGWLGPAEAGKTRECLVTRCISFAATKAHYQRKDKVVYTVQFEALADSTQPTAADLATFQDF